MICINAKKKNPFNNNKPGRSWYEGFLKRHPEVWRRLSEKIFFDKSKPPVQQLRKWFQNVYEYFDSENLMSLEAHRVFNCHEASKYE